MVTDSKTGEKLMGVTVVATSTALQFSVSAITDEHGQFSIGSLPQGTYLTTYFYSDVTVERSGIEVVKNKTTRAYQKINPAQAGGEVIRIAGTVPMIDPTSTTQSIKINKNYKNMPVPGRVFGSTVGRNTRRPGAGGTLGDDFGGFQHIESGTGDNGEPSRPKAAAAPKQDDRFKGVVETVRKDKRDVVIVVHGPLGTETQALGRGQTIKNRLVDDGVPAAKIHIMPKLGPGEPETIRVLAVAPGKKDQLPVKLASKITPGDSPVGESHFIAERPMTIRAGSSAMVAMVHGETTGGVVYLYDPVSERGDQRFAFKAVRLDNPTGDTLEPGPVTVYGDGRFIGEGITEPVPPRAAAVVPFALDKQIVVERTGAESDQIAKLVTVQRGILTAEVQHRRETRFAVTSRLTTPTTVYLRHRLESGWLLVDHPKQFTKVGDSHLFAIQLGAGETKHVAITEATPIERTFDLSTETALGMMKVFVDEPKASPALKKQITTLLAIHRGGADLQDHIRTLRDQLVEYRSRSGELHAQLLTLKAVKTGGELMQMLKTKLAEMSDRTQKATIALVETQEKLMLQRVKFQHQLAELKLTDVAGEVKSK